MPSIPIYSRPNCASSQQQQMANNRMLNVALVMPINSLWPLITHRGNVKRHLADYNSHHPATPPLPSSASVISRFNICDALATPMNPMFPGLDGFEGRFELAGEPVTPNGPPAAPLRQ